MPKPTGPSNAKLKNLIIKFERRKLPYYKRIAELLSKPTRKRVRVNVQKIEKLCKDGEVIVVPGNVLGAGKINKKVTVYAWKFSEGAKKKIEDAGGSARYLEDLLNEKIKPKIVI